MADSTPDQAADSTPDREAGAYTGPGGGLYTGPGGGLYTGPGGGLYTGPGGGLYTGPGGGLYTGPGGGLYTGPGGGLYTGPGGGTLHRTDPVLQQHTAKAGFLGIPTNPRLRNPVSSAHACLEFIGPKNMITWLERLYHWISDTGSPTRSASLPERLVAWQPLVSSSTA